MSDSQPLPPSSTQPNDNPYIGPRTFTRDHAHLFFGRERESEELFSRVVSQRLVLFYAQSGAGKSSLINTQLIPKLEDAGFAVLPVARVGGDLLATLNEPVDNIYLFNLMLNLDQSQRNPAIFAHLTLPDFLEHLTSEDGKKWVYEQEAGSNNAQAAEAERSTEAKNQAPTRNYVLIIDQFEEIIITHSERVHERADFFRQLEMAMVADGWMRFKASEMKPMAETLSKCGVSLGPRALARKPQSAASTLGLICGKGSAHEYSSLSRGRRRHRRAGRRVGPLRGRAWRAPVRTS